MAEIRDGSIRGKIGNLVGYQYKGRNYLRRKPVRTAPPTEGELKNRHQMKLVSAWLRPLNPFVRLGYRGFSRDLEGFNAAFSVIYREALQKDGFNSSIDPSLARVSYGIVGMADAMTVSQPSPRELEFTWDPSLDGTKGPRDPLIILAYDIEQGMAYYDLNGAKRYLGTDRLNFATAIPGTYHIYVAFLAERAERQSNSKYLGTVVFQE